MEENSNITNLGQVVSNTNNTTNPQFTNVVGVEPNTTNYTNMYNNVQDVSNMIVNNIQPQQPVQNVPDAVQTTQTIINTNPDNIVLGSPTPQQMAQADVVQTTVSGISQNLTQEIPGETITSELTQTTTPVNEEIKTEEPKAEEKIVEPVVQSGKPFTYKLKTETLVELVNNARRAAIYEDRLITTTVIQLVFTPDGLTVVATDATDVFKQIDTTTKFMDSCSLCVDADLLHKLVNKLDTDEVELEYDKENHILNINSNGVFKIPEQYDTQTGLNINIPAADLEVLPTDISVDVNMDSFKNLIQRSNVFAGNSNIYAQLSGVYCSDKIFSTDKVCMFSTDNLEELKNQTFYLSPHFVSLLLNIPFDSEATFNFRKNELGETKYIIIKDGDKIIGGPVSEYTSEYPLEQIERITVMTYSNEFKVDKKLLISVLDKADLFIERNSKSQSCNFVVDAATHTLGVQTFNKQADQIIKIEGDNIPTATYCLKVQNMLKALRNCVDDTVIISTDPNNNTCCKITSDDIIQSVSYSNDND